MATTINQESYILYKNILYEVRDDKAVIFNGVGKRIIVPVKKAEERIDQLLKEDKDRWN